jgi:hypothetical protein
MKTLASLLCCSAIAGAGLLAACEDKKPEPMPITTTTAAPPSTSAPAAPASAAPSASASTSAAGPADVAYEAPKAWQSAPNPNPMRKATFKIPKVAGDPEDAELTVSSATGGVDANVKRWAGQFGSATPKVDARTVNGLKVSIVEIKGTYSSGGMMGAPAAPKEKQMLLGAIVELGDGQTFFKLVGPEKTVTAARKDFDAFVGTFRAK